MYKMKINVFSLALMLILIGGALFYGNYFFTPLTAEAATYNYVVDDTGDAADNNNGDGICATAGAVCTYRAAIQEANTDSDTTAITFSATGTITLASAMTSINQPVTITGPGVASITISGGNSYTPIDFISGSTGSVVTSLTLTACSSPNGCIKSVSGADTVTIGGDNASDGLAIAGTVNHVGDGWIIKNNTFSTTSGIIASNGAVTGLTISDNTFGCASGSSPNPLVKVAHVSSTNITISDNTMGSCTAFAIEAQGIAFTINDNDISVDGMNHNIIFTPMSGTSTINGNTTTAGSAGIIVNSGEVSSGNVTLTIDNNTISGGNNTGISIRGLGSGSSFTVTDNSVTSQTQSSSGLAFQDVPGAITVTGNTLSSNAESGLYIYGTGTGPSSGTISGNTMSSNESSGILVGDASALTISGNTINANESGIYLDDETGGIAGSTISGNDITNNTSHGIEIAYVDSGNSISGNTITGNSFNGISIGADAGETIAFSSNIISGNGITSNTEDFASILGYLSYDGDDYEEAFYFSSEAGFGNAVDATDYNTSITGADGINNFNLALLDDGGGTYYIAYFREDFVNSSAAAKTEADTWGLGTFTVNVWQLDVWVADSATSDYTFDLTAGGVTEDEDSTLVYTGTGGYTYGGYTVASASNTFTGETLSGNGNGFIFAGTSAASNTISNGSINALGYDIKQKNTDAGDTNSLDNVSMSTDATCRTGVTCSVASGVIDLNYDMVTSVAFADGEVISGVTVNAVDVNIASTSLGDTDVAGDTSSTSIDAYQINSTGVLNDKNDYSFTGYRFGYGLVSTENISIDSQDETLSFEFPYLQTTLGEEDENEETTTGDSGSTLGPVAGEEDEDEETTTGDSGSTLGPVAGEEDEDEDVEMIVEYDPNMSSLQVEALGIFNLIFSKKLAPSKDNSVWTGMYLDGEPTDAQKRAYGLWIDAFLNGYYMP
jgi:parallel beta-helix repeat protein